MGWRSIDFQGIVSLDRTLVDQIEEYLQEKETRLAHQLLESIKAPTVEVFGKPSIPGVGVHLKLSDAVEGLTRKIRTLSESQIKQLSPDQGEGFIKELNTILWEFTQVLEGCVIELFQQIKLVSIDKWGASLFDVVKSLKESLIHYIDDLIWVIKRLEGPLLEHSQKIKAVNRGWKSWFSSNPPLDPNLLVNINQTEKYLKSQFEEFNTRFIECTRLSGIVETYLEKMKTYPVLALMESQDHNLYVDLYRLLKLRELNPHPHSTLALETVQAIKNLCSIGNAIRIFKLYFYGLKDSFFNSSLELKSFGNNKEEFVEKNNRLQDKLKDYYNELLHLITTIGKYREFILETDPNPYVRSRWGFTERPVAPEPPKAKALLFLIYRVEELKGWYEHFSSSLTLASQVREEKEKNAKAEIERLLHEMGQPLISHSMMRNRCERLLEAIKECDEVGNPDKEIIPYLDEVFSQAMRVDWKYHVLHELDLFHELYRIHQGLQFFLEDPSHAFRMDRFTSLFKQIENWVRSGNVYSHIQEIELDINDMRAYLQDFLALIQRTVREKTSDLLTQDAIKKFRLQLLEYRYLFGQFIYNIVTKNKEGRQLRNQFLFVDQYFETSESLLHDLKSIVD